MYDQSIQLEKIIKCIQSLENQISKLTLLNSEILSFDEACIYIGVSKSTLYKLTSKNRIKHFKPNGKKIFFERKDIDNWILTNSNIIDISELENARKNVSELLKTI